MAVSSTAISTSFNFLQLSTIFLDHIPRQLRDIFKQRILEKYKKQWLDNQRFGAWLIQQERWHSKLLPDGRHKLSYGILEEWNSPLLFHLLLYSSHCLLADPITLTQANLYHQSNLVMSSVHNAVDLTEIFCSGDKAIFDQGEECFCSEVVTVHRDYLLLKHPFQSKQTQSQSAITVPFYKCKPQWLAVEKLYLLSNRCFGFCKTAVVTSEELQQVILEVEAIYATLNIPQQLKSKLLDDESEKVTALEVDRMVKQYAEQWMMEIQQMKKLNNELGEEVVQLMNEDVSDVKGTVQKIEQTLWEAEEVTSKGEEVSNLQQETAVWDSIQQATGNIKPQTKTASDNVIALTNEQRVVTKCCSKIERLSQVYSHATALKQHDIELSRTEFQHDTSQHQISTAVVCHATKIVEEVSVGSGKKLSKPESTASTIANEVKTTEEATAYHSQDCKVKNEVGKTQGATELFKKSSDTLFHQLNPSHFEGEIAYFAEKYHNGTRKWLFNDLKVWQKETHSDEIVSNLCLIVGNPGMGKSVVAAKVCLIEKEKGTLAGCFFFQHQKGHRNNPKMLLQTFVYQLCCSIPDYCDIIGDLLAEVNINLENAQTFFTKLILEPLNQLPKIQPHMYFVIDALDECNFESWHTLFKLIIQGFVKLPKWLNIIMTTRPDRKIIQKLSKVKPVLELLPDDPRNIHDIQIYLQDTLHGRMQQTELEVAINLLLKKSQGMFLYFHFAIGSVLEHENIELVVPAGIGDYYEQNFARLYDKLGENKYRILLQAVTAALADLPVELVSFILNVDVTEASAVIDIVSAVLPVQNRCIHVFHKSVYDWLSNEEEAERYAVSPIEGHLHLAVQCYSILQEIEATVTTSSDISSNHIWKYALQNLVMHLCNTNPESFITSREKHGVWQQKWSTLDAALVSVLLDLQFLYFKVHLSGGYLEDILEDYNKAIELLSASDLLVQKLNICKNFLLQQADLLLKLPHMIFQCALNSSSEIAEHFNVQQYFSNPVKACPEMKLYLEIARKSEKPSSELSSLATFRCTDIVTCCTQTPDEQLLICYIKEGFIHIWNKDTGELIHKGMVDNCLNAEKIKPSQQKHSDKVVLQLTSRVKKISVSPDGKFIVYGNVNEALDTDGNSIPLITGIERDTNNSTFSPDGKKLLSWTVPVTKDNTPIYIKLWNFESKTCVQLEDVGNRWRQPLSGCFSHDSQYAFCGHKDAKIIKWAVSSGEPTAVMYTNGRVILKGSEEFQFTSPEKEDAVRHLECTGDGHFLVTRCQSGILIWDAAALVLLQTITLDPRGDNKGRPPEFKACSFSSDGKHLVAGTSDGYVMTWVLQVGSEHLFEQQICSKLNSTSFPVKQCFFDSNLNVISAVGFFVYIHSYEELSKATTGAISEKKVYPGRPCLSNSQILPQEKSVVILNDYMLRLLQIPGLNLLSNLLEYDVQHIGPWSADMKYFLAFTPDGNVMIVNINQVNSYLMKHWHLNLLDGPVKCTDIFTRWSISNKGLVLKSSKRHCFYLLFENCGKYTPLKISQDNKAPLTCLEFSPDGRLFISADITCTMLIWKVASDGDRPVVQKLKQVALEFAINKLASFGNDRLFVSSGLNIRIFSWPDIKQITVMDQHTPSVRTIVVSPDRNLVVSASELRFPPNNMEVVVWEASSGKVVSCLPLIQDSIHCLSFACGNQFICFYTRHEGMIQVYEVTTGALVSCLSFPTGISSMTASSDLVCLLTDGSLRFIKLHNL